MTTTAPTAEEGDEVRIVKTGFVGYLQDINPNPNWAADDETWAEVWRYPDDMSDARDIDGPDDIVLVRKAADIPARMLPTPSELAEHLANGAHSGFGPIEITETDTNEPDGQFIIVGVSATGRPFTARVTVSDIERDDL